MSCHGSPAQVGTGLAGQQRGTDPMSAGIGHENTDAVTAQSWQRDEIKAVTAHVVRGPRAATDLEARQPGHDPRQKALLNPLSDPAFVLLREQLLLGRATFDELTDMAR